MNHKEFKEGLERRGVDVTMATVRNWAKKGLIPSYTLTPRKPRRKKKIKQPSELRADTTRELAKQFARHFPELNSASVSRFGFYDEPFKILPISCYGQRERHTNFDPNLLANARGLPGRPTDWSKDALVEAAAVWAMKHCNGKILPKAVTPEIIGNVQLIAREVYSSPHPLYRIKERVIDSRWPDDPFTYTDVEMKLVRDDTLHELTVTYIAALEKAWWGISVRQPMRVVLKEDILERDHPDLSLSKAMFETRLAREDRRLTPFLEEMVERTAKNPVVQSTICIKKPTDAKRDEIVLLVRQPGSEEWVDSRKLVIQSG